MMRRCVYVFYVCMYFTYVCIYIYTHTHLHTYISIYIYIYMSMTVSLTVTTIVILWTVTTMAHDGCLMDGYNSIGSSVFIFIFLLVLFYETSRNAV